MLLTFCLLCVHSFCFGNTECLHLSVHTSIIKKKNLLNYIVCVSAHARAFILGSTPRKESGGQRTICETPSSHGAWDGTQVLQQISLLNYLLSPPTSFVNNFLKLE